MVDHEKCNKNENYSNLYLNLCMILIIKNGSRLFVNTFHETSISAGGLDYQGQFGSSFGHQSVQNRHRALNIML